MASPPLPLLLLSLYLVYVLWDYILYTAMLAGCLYFLYARVRAEWMWRFGRPPLFLLFWILPLTVSAPVFQPELSSAGASSFRQGGEDGKGGSLRLDQLLSSGLCIQRGTVLECGDLRALSGLTVAEETLPFTAVHIQRLPPALFPCGVFVGVYSVSVSHCPTSLLPCQHLRCHSGGERALFQTEGEAQREVSLPPLLLPLPSGETAGSAEPFPPTTAQPPEDFSLSLNQSSANTTQSPPSPSLLQATLQYVAGIWVLCGLIPCWLCYMILLRLRDYCHVPLTRARVGLRSAGRSVYALLARSRKSLLLRYYESKYRRNAHRYLLRVPTAWLREYGELSRMEATQMSRAQIARLALLTVKRERAEKAVRYVGGEREMDQAGTSGLSSLTFKSTKSPITLPKKGTGEALETTSQGPDSSAPGTDAKHSPTAAAALHPELLPPIKRPRR